MTARTCDRCRQLLEPEALAMGWPVTVPAEYGEDSEDICPSCYGDDAHCPEGHVLPADVDSGDCPTCEEGEPDHA